MPSPQQQRPPSTQRYGPGVRRPASGASSNDVGDSVLSRIQQLNTTDEGIKILLYGRSGTGKTTLWATFPGPILALLCSGGLRPGELRSVDTPANRKKIQSVVLHSSHELMEVAAHVAATGKYHTLVLDHVTGYQDMVLKEVLGLADVPLQKSWGMAKQEQYGVCVAQCKEAFRVLLNLTCNVVLVGQERSFGEGRESDAIDPAVGVGLMPSLAGWLNPACDYIAQTWIRQKVRTVQTTLAGEVVETAEKVPGAVEYCLRTGPHPVYTTKFRVPKGQDKQGSAVPEVIVDPTYDKIISLIRHLS